MGRIRSGQWHRQGPFGEIEVHICKERKIRGSYSASLLSTPEGTGSVQSKSEKSPHQNVTMIASCLRH